MRPVSRRPPGASALIHRSLHLQTLYRSLAIAGATLALALPALAQDVQERVIRFGHLNNPDHPVSFGVKRFGELLAAKSGGKLKVQEFPASQLGNEMQQQSALQGGVQQMSAPATTSLAGIVKEFGLVDFPFAVTPSRRPTRCSTARWARRSSPSCPRRGWSRWATGTWAFATSPTASARSRSPKTSRA